MSQDKIESDAEKAVGRARKRLSQLRARNKSDDSRASKKMKKLLQALRDLG